jgi:hypothetical protein
VTLGVQVALFTALGVIAGGKLSAGILASADVTNALNHPRHLAERSARRFSAKNGKGPGLRAVFGWLSLPPSVRRSQHCQS